MGLFSGIKTQIEKRKEYNKYNKETESYRLQMEKAEAQEKLSLARAKNEVREIKAEARREKYKPVLRAVSNIQTRLKENKPKKGYVKRSFREEAGIGPGPQGIYNLGNEKANPWKNPTGPGSQGIYNLGNEKANPWKNPTFGNIRTTGTAKATKKKKGLTIRIE
jgi:hypothetical protein